MKERDLMALEADIDLLIAAGVSKVPVPITTLRKLIELVRLGKSVARTPHAPPA